MIITAEQIAERMRDASFGEQGHEITEAQSILDTIRAEATAVAYGAAADACAKQLRNTGLLMSNPPQSSAAWDARNAITALTPADATAWLEKHDAAQFQAGQDAAIKGAVKGWALIRDGEIAHIRKHQEALHGLGSGETIRPCLILVGEGE